MVVGAEDVVAFKESVVERPRTGQRRDKVSGRGVFVVYGNRFSTVDEAGVTAQVAGFRPANCALSGLIFRGSQRLDTRRPC